MRNTSSILAGVTATLLANGAAFAQSDDARYGNGPQASTPAEMQQTGQLNQQSRSGTTDPPPGMSETQYESSQAQYVAQQQQYQDQLQQYQNRQERYTYDRDDYARNLRAYDAAQYEWSYPQPLAYHYDDANGLQPLYLMAEPSQQLWRAPVEGPSGAWVGRVRNVEIAPDGRPSRVEIALNRKVSVWVHPGDLRFDPGAHILYTDLSRDRLWELPGATVESAPL